MLHLFVHALAASFDADDIDVLVIKERIEQPHRVRPATDRGNQRVGQTAFGGVHLFAHFLADDRLKVADHRRIGVRPCDRADAIECVAHIGDPIAQRVVHRIFQRPTARGYGDHFGTQQTHAEDVGGLPFNIMRAHIDNALQTELGTDGGRRHTVLARTGFRDDPFLAHAPRQNDLAQHIVDLMRAGVVQLVALHVNLGTAQMFGQTLCEIQRAGATDIVGPQVVHLGPKAVIRLGLFIFRFQFEDQRHQGFRHKPPPKIAKAAILVRSGHERVEKIIVHGGAPCAWRPALTPPPRQVKTGWARRRARTAAPRP